MAWTAPFTAVTGNVFTAAQWNQYARDNLNVMETTAALTAGGLLCTFNAANTMIQRNPAVQMISPYETTATTTYTTLTTPGPAITVTHGVVVFISVGCLARNDTAGLGARMTFALTGSNTAAASDADAFYMESGNAGDTFSGTWTTIRTGLTSGTTTLTANYRAVGGGNATFAHRLLVAIPF